MTEAQIINILMFIFGIAVVRIILDTNLATLFRRKRGGELNSGAIIFYVVMKNRKSRREA